MSELAKIQRKDFKTFLNTTPSTTATWKLMGDGIQALEIAMNPQTSEETYIHENTGNTFLDSYKPSAPVELTAKKTEPIFGFIDALRKARKVLADAETLICNVWFYETPYSNWYPAESQEVSIAVDKFGGDGGMATKLGFTMNYLGDAVIGWFNAVTKVFEASPILAGATSIVIAAVTLDPVYDRNKLHYTAATGGTTAAITVVAENADAVILIKNGVTTVTNGGTATWISGANTVTVKITVGDEEVTYTIVVTKS